MRARDEVAMENLKHHILALETALTAPDTRRSAAWLETVLAPEFREFGRSGRVYDFAEVVNALVSETAPADVTIQEFDVAKMSDTVVLATYRSSRSGGDRDPRVSLRSSLWRREEDGSWRMVFHQGTPVQTP